MILDKISKFLLDDLTATVRLSMAGILLITTFPVNTYAQNRVASAHLQPVQMVAREQPLSTFLTDLYGRMGMAVSISPAVSRLGYVNGSFDKPAGKLYSEIANAFGLVNYFDGSVMHIVTASEVQTRSYAPGARAAARLVSSAKELGYLNRQNTLRATQSGMLVASGVKPFLEQVETMIRAQAGSSQTVAASSEAQDGRLSEELPVPGVTTPGAQGMVIKVFYLRYAWAQDNSVMSGSRQTLIPGIASIVRSLVSSKPSSANYTTSTRRQTVPKLRGQGLTATGSSQDVLGGRASVQDAGQPAMTSALPQVASLPQMADSGGDPSQVRVEADSRLNAIIIRDRRDRMPMYEQLIRQLDVEPQLVEIEATIIDVNTDKAEELGINWRWTDGKQDVLFGNGSASDQGLLSRGASITPIGEGLNISTVIGNGSAFVSRINLLAQKGAARVVTRPQVMTLSNIEAVFDDSDTFYVRVAGREEVDLFDVSVGTTLRVLPHVFRDKGENRIRMMISVEDGKIRQGSVDGIPVVNRSGVTTQAIMLQGQSLLVGGLVQDSRSTVDSKVPWLGDIPGAGNFFKTKNKRDARIERLFLISPRLASLTAPRTKPEPTAPELLPDIAVNPRTYSSETRSLSANEKLPIALPPAQAAPATTLPDEMKLPKRQKTSALKSSKGDVIVQAGKRRSLAARKELISIAALLNEEQKKYFDFQLVPISRANIKCLQRRCGEQFSQSSIEQAKNVPTDFAIPGASLPNEVK